MRPDVMYAMRSAPATIYFNLYSPRVAIQADVRFNTTRSGLHLPLNN